MAEARMRRVLLIAFHYPPAKGSSGVQRTLCLSRYLKERGWEPFVLTACRSAYPDPADDQISDIPQEVAVKRAFALDTARHLSVSGKYPGFLAYPDRWVSWWFAATLAAVRIVKRYRLNAIWSTYPIATAHLVALTTHNLTGCPWIADFRDSMTEPGYPADRYKRSVYKWIEERTVKKASYAVFTAPGALEMYSKRYPSIPKDRWQCILNGFDEEIFLQVARREGADHRFESEKCVLLHSGLLYPSERNPLFFFEALQELKKTGVAGKHNLEVRLRATGFDDHWRRHLARLRIDDIVSIEAPIPYKEALAEMMRAEGLLIFQASNCNHQIPAKIYEYFRAHRPILALTDPEGDTARLMKETKAGYLADLDSKDSIVDALNRFISDVRSRNAHRISETEIPRFSRREQAANFASLLDSVV